MSKKILAYLTILIAIGVSCAILLNSFVIKVIHINDPIFWGMAYGISGLLLPIITYKAIQPDFRRLYENKPLFERDSIKTHFFLVICGASAFLLYISISAFQAYWYTH